MLNKDIEWKYTAIEIVDAVDIAAKVAEFEAAGAVQPLHKTPKREWYIDKTTYRVDKSDKWTTLYYVEIDQFGYHTPKRMTCNEYRSKKEYQHRKNDIKVASSECRKTLLNTFIDFNNTTMLKAFGVTHAVDFRKFVPKPCYYIDKDYAGIDVHGVQYVDVSAMFPSNARGLMPDNHTAITVNGRVEPDEEYRFAFYTKSNHCAEYGVFDTHDYLKLPWENQKMQCFTDKGKPIYNSVADEDEVTILMKPSKYTLDTVMNNVWNMRFSDDPEVRDKAKAIANMGIGTLHRNPKTFHMDDMTDYYHVAAIILGRSNKIQYDMIDYIKKNGGLILQVIVDSIIYIGEKNYGRTEKEFGEYFNEFGRTVNYRTLDKMNKYVIFDDDRNVLKAVYSGEENAKDYIKRPEDIDHVDDILKEIIKNDEI